MAAVASRSTHPLDRLDASLQDFEHSIGDSLTQPKRNRPSKQLHILGRPSGFRYPSVHSGFGRSAMLEDDESEMDVEEEVSAGGYSPPAWRRLANGDRSSGFWRADDSREFLSGDSEDDDGGHEDDDDDDDDVDAILQEAIRTRLPAGSLSPEKERSPEPEYAQRLGKGPEALPSISEEAKPSENYFRFAVRAEVQHRTEPIDAAVNSIRSWFSPFTKSWMSFILSVLAVIMSYAAFRCLSQPAILRPVPDLIKVAGIARSFEPQIYYSESGVQQVRDLHATGLAVWDLGESMRTSNLSATPTIVKDLDELSDNLKTLAGKLTTFFANVDGDIDSILLVMDWARRELSQLQALPSPPLASAFDNLHTTLSSVGLLEDAQTGEPTRLGSLSLTVFGPSTAQRTRRTLHRTFNEFLTVLEEAVKNELTLGLALFALFDAIDQQFLNLARTVAREASDQDERYFDLLSSLWTRILGPRASEVYMYERNRQLLASVRDITVRSKGVLIEHNQRLLALKANLDGLRNKLVSPLVRSENSSHLALEDQIRGLDDVAGYLDGVRSRQKAKLLEALFGPKLHDPNGHVRIEDPDAYYAAKGGK